MEYALWVKSLRLEATRQALDGGRLQLLTADGNRLAEFVLDPVSGGVISDLLYLNGFPKFAMGEIKGRAAQGLLLDKNGREVAHAITVGESNADIIMKNLDVSVDNVVKIESAEIRHA